MPRIPSSILAAGIIAVALVLWMLSGLLFPAGPGESGSGSPQSTAEGPVTVQVREQSARTVTRYLTNHGQTEADRLVTVKAETRGRIAAVGASEGERVTEGAMLARIAMGDREARLQEAKALVAQRESEYEAARNLGESGYQARVRVQEAEAALASARARLRSIREDIEHTEVRAPFGAFLEKRHVEKGTFLNVGSPVAVLADLDPIVASVRVAQQSIDRVRPDIEATVHLADGRSVTGRVRYLGRTADAGSRTFRVEVAVPNEDGAIRAGLSAEVRIPVAEVRAHFVSPAALTLDADGRLGIKTVDGDDRVAFHEVDLVRSESDGAWVTGLPERARVIVVGQGFARVGERVEAVPADRTEAPETAPEPPSIPVLPQGPESP